MEKVRWQTIRIKVPKEMVFKDKNGNLRIESTLTKNENISKRDKKPSLLLESANIDEPLIINKGVKVQASDLKGQQERKETFKDNIAELLKKTPYERFKRKLKVKQNRGTEEFRKAYDIIIRAAEGAVNFINREDDNFKNKRGKEAQYEAKVEIKRIYDAYQFNERAYSEGKLYKQEYEDNIKIFKGLKKVKNMYRLCKLANKNDKNGHHLKFEIKFIETFYKHLL